ncbi:MAG: hypothetical protein AMXMBFR42_03840 [Burkholderiales bacterium]
MQLQHEGYVLDEQRRADPPVAENFEHRADESGLFTAEAAGSASLTQILARKAGTNQIDAARDRAERPNVRIDSNSRERPLEYRLRTRPDLAQEARPMAGPVQAELEPSYAGE